jgi:hypothetical protein
MGLIRSGTWCLFLSIASVDSVQIPLRPEG